MFELFFSMFRCIFSRRYVLHTDSHKNPSLIINSRLKRELKSSESRISDKIGQICVRCCECSKFVALKLKFEIIAAASAAVEI